MFSQPTDKPAPDDPTAPAGMRELPPQPAKPQMPAYDVTMPATAQPPSPAGSQPEPGATAPGPEDSVIAKDDHLEGTFTSRGTVVVMGSVKGRIEAVQVRIEDGASVDADVIVDEAIIAGEFTGNLTCRERLEARASGRINGRVETFRLMLHEGASVEGEMHMLTEAPKDASETIRGSAPLRGDTAESEAEAKPGARPSPAAPAAATPPVTPASGVKPTAGVGAPAGDSPAPTSSADASTVRSSVVETLKAENAQIIKPRGTTTTRGYGYGSAAGSPPAAGRDRRGSGSTGF